MQLVSASLLEGSLDPGGTSIKYYTIAHNVTTVLFVFSTIVVFVDSLAVVKVF